MVRRIPLKSWNWIRLSMTAILKECLSDVIPCLISFIVLKYCRYTFSVIRSHTYTPIVYFVSLYHMCMALISECKVEIIYLIFLEEKKLYYGVRLYSISQFLFYFSGDILCMSFIKVDKSLHSLQLTLASGQKV